MHPRKWLSLAAAAQALAWQSPLFAQESKPGPSMAEFKQLQNEVAEQRQLIIQLMQNEQQRYDMLLRLIQGGSKTALEGSAAAQASTPLAGGAASPAGKAPVADEPRKRLGTLEGKISVPGGDMSDVYVYVEDVRSAPARGKFVEIKQENKQFSPRVAVVQTGTTVSFPNLDPIFHNVFSNSPRNSFDLGSYRAGDKARSVVMSSPGVVDIFCNMHSRMTASVLVVPSRLYTRVRGDGTFRLESVPVGVHEVVAWSPTTRPVKHKVEVTAEGAHATFELEYTEMGSHTNKLGQPYGSYKE